jgi:hypothetical protein
MTAVFPIASSLGKPSARTQACSVRIDPFAQLRPVPDQRFVRYLDKGITIGKVAFSGQQRSYGTAVGWLGSLFEVAPASIAAL